MITAWGEMTLGGWLWMAAWISALLVMVWILVRSLRSRSTEQDALDILRARFARGEISIEEFERARDALSESHEEPSR